MATSYTHVQLSNVDSSGNVNVLYPQSTGTDVSIDRSKNNKLPASATNVQGLANSINTAAFEDKNKLIYLGEGDTDSVAGIPEAEIDDTVVSDKYTWSSEKIVHNTVEVINYSNYLLSEIPDKDVMNRMFSSPKVIMISGACVKDNGPIVAESTFTYLDYEWTIEYFPFTVRGDGRFTYRAYQIWTGINTHASVKPTTPIIRFIRWNYNTSVDEQKTTGWNEFVKIFPAE